MKKRLLERIKSYKFWMALSGAVVVFLQCLGVKINDTAFNTAITAFCGVLVVLGIIDDYGDGSTAV